MLKFNYESILPMKNNKKIPIYFNRSVYCFDHRKQFPT